MRNSPAFAFARALRIVVMRDAYFRVSVLAIAILFSIPSLFALSMGADSFSRAHLKEELGAEPEVYLVQGSEVPNEFISSTQEKQRLIARAAAAPDGPEYCEAVADFRQYYADGFASGKYIASNGDTLYQAECARVQLFRSMAQSSDPYFYWRSTDVPLAYYIPFMLGIIPAFLLFLPIASAACACRRALANNQMLALAPISPLRCYVATASVLLSVSMTAFAVSCAVGSLVALLHNGPGDFGYPVVYVLNGETLQTTLGMLLFKFSLVQLALFVFFSLTLAVAVVFSTSLVCKIIFIVIVAAPFLPWYFDGTIPDWLLLMLPSTYLDVASVVGSPDYLCGLEIAPVAGMTPGRAGATALIGGFVAAGFAVACAALSRIARKRRSHAQS